MDDKEIKIMKNLIVVVFIITAFSVPCMAEGIEPNGLFGLHGSLWTLWETEPGEWGFYFGFYDGKTYLTVTDYGCGTGPSNNYVNLLFFSVFHFTDDYRNIYGFLFPLLGIGVAGAMGGDDSTGEPIIVRGVLKKVSDKWYPEDCIDTNDLK